jgi:hypothetical protein
MNSRIYEKRQAEFNALTPKQKEATILLMKQELRVIPKYRLTYSDIMRRVRNNSNVIQITNNLFERRNITLLENEISSMNLKYKLAK